VRPPVADTAETEHAVNGYALVLPPAWRRIPVQHGTRPAIRGVVDEVLRRVSEGVSRDSLTPYRIDLERRLSEMAKQARSAGGVDLYLPVEYAHGVTITASFVVSQVTLPEPPPDAAGPAERGDAEQADTAQLVGYLTAADGDATPVEVAGVAAARKESVAAADPAQQIAYGSRRVDYMIPVPGQSRGMVVVAFSTIGDGNPEGDFAKLLVELFDAIMTTFRWARDQSENEAEDR
jgi:hypothetical protein